MTRNFFISQPSKKPFPEQFAIMSAEANHLAIELEQAHY
jgi:hypothetical protein